MNAIQANPTEQSALWNGRAGRAWIDGQATLDLMFSSFEDLLVDAVRATSARRVLDVGCGTGSTTLAAARAAGAQGNCLGVDISEPMVAVARERAEREGSTARFIGADVQTHAFEPASFDLVISRFGVMFFDDPVAAFANLRRASSANARLQVIAWRSAAENPYMTTAERAAAPLLPNMPVRQPGAPGQFAFADQHRVASILQESGWGEIDIQPIDVSCTYPEKNLVGYFTRLGAVGQVLEDMDEATRRQVIGTVRAAFDPFVHGDEVRFTAACWMIGAKAPDQA
ncbi:class I SAM-dependent methyltransferase [Variovorax sp. ZS18.2.2]|uniref:class I SAM-dependent methyltransferase n=1 Tax=Variovorax sp. ZS18.2.2 TaxID=2971255 RepID=UPI002150834C|nr:class I SAM-dependent methyltransferase [Variovorax sp. ZS18.2.2]MCR6477246.1 class I SAM-dependent methyltransferase [Variovorax sp. ZS18.2.2]